MKRLLSVFLIVGCILWLCACSSSSKVDDSTVGKIVYGEKYASEGTLDRPEEEQVYYIVYKDHIVFQNYFEFDGEVIEHYKMKYKYTIVDEGTLAYFYDSVEVYDDSEKKEFGDTASGVLMFSENVLMNTNMSKYVRESYYEDELTNYCKTEED